MNGKIQTYLIICLILINKFYQRFGDRKRLFFPPRVEYILNFSDELENTLVHWSWSCIDYNSALKPYTHVLSIIDCSVNC